MKEQRKSYPSNVSDEEWAFCVRYLALMTEATPQRLYPLREIFNALRYQIRVGSARRRNGVEWLGEDGKPMTATPNLPYESPRRRFHSESGRKTSNGPESIVWIKN